MTTTIKLKNGHAFDPNLRNVLDEDGNLFVAVPEGFPVEHLDWLVGLLVHERHVAHRDGEAVGEGRAQRKIQAALGILKPLDDIRVGLAMVAQHLAFRCEGDARTEMLDVKATAEGSR